MQVLKNIETKRNLKRASSKDDNSKNVSQLDDGKTTITSNINININESNDNSKNLLGSKRRNTKDGKDISNNSNVGDASTNLYGSLP